MLTACSGGGSDAAPPAPQQNQPKQSAGSSDTVSEAVKGKDCEAYRDLSAQVEAATTEAQGITVSSEADGQKVTELMTKVSDLTEKANAAYALCYAKGQNQ